MSHIVLREDLFAPPLFWTQNREEAIKIDFFLNNIYVEGSSMFLKVSGLQRQIQNRWPEIVDSQSVDSQSNECACPDLKSVARDCRLPECRLPVQ